MLPFIKVNEDFSYGRIFAKINFNSSTRELSTVKVSCLRDLGGVWIWLSLDIKDTWLLYSFADSLLLVIDVVDVFLFILRILIGVFFESCIWIWLIFVLWVWIELESILQSWLEILVERNDNWFLVWFLLKLKRIEIDDWRLSSCLEVFLDPFFFDHVLKNGTL